MPTWRNRPIGEHGFAGRTLQFLIRSKLEDGRLPRDRFATVGASPGVGEKCDACESLITKSQLIVEGISPARGRGRSRFEFHVRCFQLWDDETRPKR